MNRLVLLAMAIICSQPAWANCEPDRADIGRDCISCGNLEQNPTRGIDEVWNAAFNRRGTRIGSPMQRALRLRGYATANLIFPPYSSPGVLFYRGIIRDPSFRITNSATYSEALGLQARLEIDPLQPGYLQLRAEITTLLASSTTTGTDPYIVSVYDQDGNLVTQERIERGTGVLDRAGFGERDLNPDPRYQRSECIARDPRFNGEGTTSATPGGYGGTGGSPGSTDSPDPYEERCGYTQVDGGERRRTCRSG